MRKAKTKKTKAVEINRIYMLGKATATIQNTSIDDLATGLVLRDIGDGTCEVKLSSIPGHWSRWARHSKDDIIIVEHECILMPVSEWRAQRKEAVALARAEKANAAVNKEQMQTVLQAWTSENIPEGIKVSIMQVYNNSDKSPRYVVSFNVDYKNLEIFGGADDDDALDGLI